MPDGVKLWRVTEDDSLREIKTSRLDREERIEQWIAQDVSVLEPGESKLLVIGRQVRTDYDKEIDLLCMNKVGDLVIVELKRDKTPRDVTAQALDYASWIKDLGTDKIEEIAADYLKKHLHLQKYSNLRGAFDACFGIEYPKVLNSAHSIKIVASEVSESTERIIRYLSSYGIDINFVRFQMHYEADEEFLVRTFTVAPDEVEQNVKRSGISKRTSTAKTIKEVLGNTENDAEAEFLQRQLESPTHELSPHGVELLFRSAGKIRFRVRARSSHVHVIQNGRFPEDERLWKENLSKSDIGYRAAKAHISFDLYTKEDFAFFDKQLGVTFPWSPAGIQIDDEAEDE